jgi:hypothetical protein
MLLSVIDAVSHLNELMNKLVPSILYPSGVQHFLAERIPGTAFFPGGSGLSLEDRDAANVEFPVSGVMVLGHNFDSENGFKESIARGKEKLTTEPGGRCSNC